MRVRVHQHVNPLSPRFQILSDAVDFQAVFADVSQPIHLDIGAARGRFLLQMAQIFPQINFVGLEIREPLVIEANRLAREKNLTNLHYEYSNATLSLRRQLENLPPNLLQTVTIQFPDPCYKKKHAKRRMVKPVLVETLAEKLAVGGRVFVQTDVEFLFAEMSQMFEENPNFTRIATAENPFPVKTEREKSVETRQLPVYRVIFVKN